MSEIDITEYLPPGLPLQDVTLLLTIMSIEIWLRAHSTGSETTGWQEDVMRLIACTGQI
jgi:hypothetical protein